MNKPFICRPYGKDYIWGGQRLLEEFGKKDLNGDSAPLLAESWECSTHPDGPCAAAGGEYAGMELRDILRAHPEFLGSHVRKESGGEDGRLPVLVKFIDAKQALSVQVHPDDVYAKKFENGQSGKNELWYILDAAKDASVVYGLSRSTEKETLRQAVKDGTLKKYLQKVPVKKDQVFFVGAGTVHAIGAGCLIAEIQENSNLTYRLYDYDRTDQSGQKRPLHLEKALEAANLTVEEEPKQPLRVLRYMPGCARELLGRCRHFEVYRMLVNTERKQIVKFRADGLSFRVLLCIDGCGMLFYEDTMLEVYKGDCVFVPADSVMIRMHGKMQFLDVRC